MPAEDSAVIVRRLFEEVYNQAHLEALDDLVAPAFVGHGPGLPRAGTRAALKSSVTRLRAAFPDLHVTVDDTFASGDRVAARMTLRGTHKGALLGLAPTGRCVTWTGIDVYRVAGGRIVEAWAERDRLGLSHQLTARPARHAGRPALRVRPWLLRLRRRFLVDWGLYPRLEPAARTWRERASLARYILARLLTRGSDRRDITIYLDGAQYSVGLGTMEVYILQELYHDRYYERVPDFIPKAGWTSFDLGANVGLFAIQQARRGVRVYAFEPNPDCYRRLTHNVAVNRLAHRVRTFNCAVGAVPGVGAMRVPLGRTIAGFVQPVADPAAAPAATVTVTPLDHLVPTLGVERIDLLKIDVEGAEADVLRGAAHTLGMVERIIVECHGPRRLHGVAALLDRYGFAEVQRIQLNARQTLLFARRPLPPAPGGSALDG